MKFIYNESLTKSVVENYFKTHEDIDGELEITCGSKTIPSVGRCIAYHQVPTISFRLKGTMESDGEVYPVEISLEEYQVENAFTTMMEATGRTVKKVSFSYDEKGFKSVTIETVGKRKVKQYSED